VAVSFVRCLKGDFRYSKFEIHTINLRRCYNRGFRQLFIMQMQIKKEARMLSWTVTFLIIALVAAFFGFGGIAGTAVEIAKVLFFVFLVLFIISLVFGWRRPPIE